MRGLAKRAPGPGNVGLAERPVPAPGRGQVVPAVAGAGERAFAAARAGAGVKYVLEPRA